MHKKAKHTQSKILNIRKAGAEHMLDQAVDDAVKIAEAQMQAFQSIARGLDEALNGELRGNERQVGFIVMMYPFHEPEMEATVITNGQLEDVLEIVDRQRAYINTRKDFEKKEEKGKGE